MRILFIIFATLLASSSVALAGMIGWIGLVMPHISRFLLGANHRFMLVAWRAFFALLRHHSAKCRDERNPHRHYHKCVWCHHLFCGAACVKEKI